MKDNAYNLSQGYKKQFIKVDSYDIPEYGGNNPAAYVLTNANIN